MRVQVVAIACIVGIHSGVAHVAGHAACLHTCTAATVASDCDDRRTFPLHDAVRANDLYQVIALLQAGADPNEPAYAFGWTPLHYASARDINAAIVRTLLSHGADVNASDDDAFTPMHRAAGDGAAAAVVALLGAGAEPDSVDAGGNTPLMYAVKTNPYTTDSERLETARHLLTAGARIERQGSNPGPLQFAATRVDAKMLALLQEFGGDVHERDEYGNTLLAIAAGAGRTRVVEYLAEFIDVNAANARGETALIRAVRDAPVAEGTVSYLLERGAETAAQDAHGKTALHHAAERADIPTVRLLLEAGADRFAQDAANWRPVDYAIQSAHRFEEQVAPVAKLPEHVDNPQEFAALAIRRGRAIAAHRRVQDALLVAMELME